MMYTSTSQVGDLQIMVPIAPINSHPMQTRSKSGIIKMKVLSATLNSDTSLFEPTTFAQAAKLSQWQDTMKVDIATLHTQ